MSQPPTPPFSGPPYPEQPPSGPPYQGQQPPSGPPHPGQQPYPGQSPYSGQSYPGQPNPDVPASVPPGYPPYGQPDPTPGGYPPPGQQGDYGQAGHPQSGPPGGYPPPGQPEYANAGYPQSGGYPGAPAPQQKSRTVPIVLVSLAVVLVLCLGGGLAVFLSARTSADNTASTVPTTSPTVSPVDPTTPSTTEPTPTEESTSTVTLAAPRTLGGRSKLTDPQFASLAKDLESGLGDVPGATNSIGAIYGSVQKQNIVIIAGAEAPIDDPARELNGTFVGAGVGGLKVTGIQRVDPGALGGSAKCGKAEEQDIDMVLCGWADEGSVGWVIYFFKSVSSAKAEFPRLRAQIEKKS